MTKMTKAQLIDENTALRNSNQNALINNELLVIENKKLKEQIKELTAPVDSKEDKAKRILWDVIKTGKPVLFSTLFKIAGDVKIMPAIDSAIKAGVVTYKIEGKDRILTIKKKYIKNS